MGLLLEMIDILGRHKVNRIEVMGNPGEGTGKLYELYNGFQSGQFKTEEDASSAIYDAPPTDRRYQKLKNKLKIRLINTMMFVDPNQPRFSKANLAKFNCLKLYTAQQLLDFYKGGSSNSELSLKVIKEADRFGFYFLALEASREIRHRAVLKGDGKLLAEASNRIRRYQKIIEAECMAEEFYFDIALSFSKSRSMRSELVDKAIEREAQLRPFVDQYDTSKLTYYGYHFFALRYMLDRDYSGSIKECEVAIKKLEKLENVNPSFIFSMFFRMLQCHLQLKNYEAGEKTVQRCLELTRDGSVYNFYITLEMHFLLNMHTDKYEKAREIYQDAINAPKYKNLPPQLKENWKIYGAFIQYFAETGILKSEQEEAKFRLGKFLNEVPTYSRDKRGLNIPILIIQILFLLHRRKFNDVIDRTEALNTYVYRYLKKDGSYRSNCFIKMLLTLPQADFHRQGVLRKAEKYHKKLLAEPLEVSGEAHEVEIMPYEKLWELVLDSLENKFQRAG